jgi:dihydrofolate reductase
MIPLAIVVARARNGVIGKDGGLPWRLKSDMALFKQHTFGKPVIMGRKTWDSLPRKPLPGRMNIVLTRDGSFEPHGALPVEIFGDAVQIGREQAEDDGAEEVCVIGGAALFDMAMAKTKRLYLTEVDAEPSTATSSFPPSTRRRGPRSAARNIRPARPTTTPSSSGCWSGDKPVTPWP